MSDHDLLQSYWRDRSAMAFATLVERHIGLVYSAARRQVRSSSLAEEVAQDVFIELSRCARKSPPDPPLAPWLYVVTRRTAIDALRRETRRLVRETTAAEIAAMQIPPESWSKVEDSIDEAMESLNDTERTAIILRFFQNLSLREVGDSLGISEDTAQKRVSRALDRLRVFFAGRGVAVGSAALAAEISAHAAPAAPAGLAAAISSSTAVLPSMAVTAAKQLVMTTTQKTLIGAAAVIAVVVAADLYPTGKIRRQKEEIARLEKVSAGSDRDIRQLATLRNAALAQADKIAAARNAATASNDPALYSRLKALIATVNKLKERLDRDPGQQIPELRFIYDIDWFNVAQKHPDLATDEHDYHVALAELRNAAKTKFLPLMEVALNEYLKASDGVLPTDTTQLARFSVPPLDPAILQRYEMVASGPVSALPARESPTVIKEKVPPALDTEYDQWAGFELHEGTGISWFLMDGPQNPVTPPELGPLQAAADQALKAYRAANGGKEPEEGEVEKLLPFFQKPEDAAAFLKAYNDFESKSLTAPLQEAMNEALEAFHATHHGAEPKDAMELASYFRKPADGAQYYLVWKKRQTPPK